MSYEITGRVGGALGCLSWSSRAPVSSVPEVQCESCPVAAMAAPLAHFDEDWQDFNEFRPTSEWPNQLDQINSNVGDTTGFEDFSDLDNSFSGEICSFKSMEDLVNDFDEKLNMCFRNYNTKVENIAPVKPITEDNFLKDDE